MLDIYHFLVGTEAGTCLSDVSLLLNTEVARLLNEFCVRKNTIEILICQFDGSRKCSVCFGNDFSI